MEAPYLDELNELKAYQSTKMTPQEIIDLLHRYDDLRAYYPLIEVLENANKKRLKGILEGIVRDINTEIKDSKKIFGFPQSYCNGVMIGLKIARMLVNKQIDKLERGADV